MNFSTISALVLRYLFLYTRTPMRMVELVFWPVVDLVVWGNVTVFIQKNTNPEFGSFVLFFLGGMILWDIMFRAQQGVAISFLEDVWTRNLLNIFVAPVRTAEYVSATIIVGASAGLDRNAGVNVRMIHTARPISRPYPNTDMNMPVMPQSA